MMLINAFSLYSQYDCGMALGSLSDGKVGLHYPDYPTRGEDKDPSKPSSHPHTQLSGGRFVNYKLKIDK